VGVKAKDLIKKLLVIDRTKRLGCIKGGGRAVREHKWFDGLDWDALYEGKLEVLQHTDITHTAVLSYCYALL
jgi:hypothetical protein